MSIEKKEECCHWRLGDYGSFGIPSLEFRTSCEKNYDYDGKDAGIFCKNCGKRIIFVKNS